MDVTFSIAHNDAPKLRKVRCLAGLCRFTGMLFFWNIFILNCCWTFWFLLLSGFPFEFSWRFKYVSQMSSQFPRIILLSLLFFSGLCVIKDSAPITDDPWDLDGPCQKYVEVSNAKINFLNYRFSEVCSSSVRNGRMRYELVDSAESLHELLSKLHYLQATGIWNEAFGDIFRRHRFKAFNFQNNVFSLDNRTCSQVIYDTYLLSYSSDISTALTSKIWEKSRCDCK